jgi:integrase
MSISTTTSSSVLSHVSIDEAEVAKNSGRFSADNPPPKRYWEATPCEGPGCTNIVPAGFYPSQRMRSFCSGECRNRDAAHRYVIGTCLCGCGGDVLGQKNQVGKKLFVSDEHRKKYELDRIMGPTGPFRALIEEYMATQAPNYYALGTLHAVRYDLAKFFRYAVQVLNLKVLDDVRSSAITKFIAVERERGLTSRNFVGHLSTFFGWLIAEERYDRANPVVPRIHNQRCAPAEARPYNDRDLETIWNRVEASGKPELMLAFAIGEECGLRVGEVANIRLSDVDERAQTIFVRLPTKNMRTRTVPYHGKVKKYLNLWLAKRDPQCADDHLLYNNAFHCFNGNQLDARFKQLLSKEPDPAGSFHFHRLRHTWATRLMNNGMELAVLKELGGWEKWNSMQRYIKVLENTVRHQYEAAYTKLQEQLESGGDEAMSLMDFVLMEDGNDVTNSEPAT